MIKIEGDDVIVTKDDGFAEKWKLYFYFRDAKRSKGFYFIYKEEDPDGLVVMASKDGKNLVDVDEEELAEAEEMLEAYENDPKIKDLK
jgi:hypothetical protein